MPTLLETLEFAQKHHGENNALDKGGKTPYYWHLLRVMLRLQTDDLELLQIALLHDVVEDTSVTLDMLRAEGYSERVIEGVKWSSKNMFDLTFNQWMKLIGEEAPVDTVLLKIADISDNLGFERMRGLMGRSSKPFVKPTDMTLAKKVDRMVEKNMRLSGEMGVFQRYYKGWNLIFENTERLNLIDKVYVGDFCNIKQLKSLSEFIPKEEMLTYLKLNKINCWTITGELIIKKDKANQDYLALTLSSDDIIYYANFLNTKIDSSFLDNQQKRDSGEYHLTVINAAQYSKLNKYNPQLLSSVLINHLGKKYDVFTYGIGSNEEIIKDKSCTSWFTVCENGYLTSLRESLNLNKQHFHITLAFENKDVRSVAKDKNTIVFNNTVLWDSFCNQFYPLQKKYRM